MEDISKEEIQLYCKRHNIVEPTCKNCGETTLKKKNGKLISPSLLKETCSRSCSKEYKIKNDYSKELEMSLDYLRDNKIEYKNDALSIYLMKNNLKSYEKCPICNSGDMYNYKDLVTGEKVVTKVKKYCSNKCSSISTSSIRLSKAKETIKDRYCVENVSQCSVIREKIKQTNLDKYGVANVMQHKEISSKSKNNRKKNFNSDEYKEKIKKRLEKIKKEQIDIWDDIFREKNLSVVKYINSDSGIDLLCSKCSNVSTWSISHLHKLKNLEYSCCKYCNSEKFGGGKVSNIHLIIRDFIEILGIEYIENSFVLGNREIDIYIPSMKIGFEINGLYYHTSERLGKTYHQTKTKLSKEKGIQLIHLWEDDINFKLEIVKSIIRNKLNKNESKIYARKCSIEEVSYKESNSFLEDNHLQGGCNSSIRLGLYYNNELVSLMTFGKSRFDNNTTEIIRFCNLKNFSIVGGASKLFKYFIKNYEFDKIVSYANRDISNGFLYEKLGFRFIKECVPSMYWFKRYIRENRFNYQKHKLELSEEEKKMSGSQIMEKRGYKQIHDSGNLKYIYEKTF